MSYKYNNNVNYRYLSMECLLLFIPYFINCIDKKYACLFSTLIKTLLNCFLAFLFASLSITFLRSTHLIELFFLTNIMGKLDAYSLLLCFIGNLANFKKSLRIFVQFIVLNLILFPFELSVWSSSL